MRTDEVKPPSFVNRHIYLQSWSNEQEMSWRCDDVSSNSNSMAVRESSHTLFKRVYLESVTSSLQECSSYLGCFTCIRIRHYIMTTILILSLLFASLYTNSDVVCIPTPFHSNSIYFFSTPQQLIYLTTHLIGQSYCVDYLTSCSLGIDQNCCSQESKQILLVTMKKKDTHFRRVTIQDFCL